MTPDGFHPRDIYELRLKRALSLAASKHENVGNLSADAHACSLFLSTGRVSLDEVDSPVSKQVRRALARHREEDPFQFDDSCAAEFLLAVHNTLEAVGEEDQ